MRATFFWNPEYTKTNLNQFHQRNRIKKVKSTKSVLSFCDACYFTYWQRRGVGRKDGVTGNKWTREKYIKTIIWFDPSSSKPWKSVMKWNDNCCSFTEVKIEHFMGHPVTTFWLHLWSIIFYISKQTMLNGYWMPGFRKTNLVMNSGQHFVVSMDATI